MEEKVFDRVEKKYLITIDEKTRLLGIIKDHISESNYHKSDIINIYFDNDNYDMISDSIDWVDFKKKVRVRSYIGYDRVFIELKTKIHSNEENVGYKRRVMITRKDYKAFVNGKKSLVDLAGQKIESPNDLQIAKELDYMIKTFDLKPKILVSYQRESYKDDNGLRITFDENLKYRNTNLNLKNQKNDIMFFKDNRNIIMEVKTSEAMPLWFVEALSKLKIYPCQFSKIGKIYQRINKKKGSNV